MSKQRYYKFFVLFGIIFLLGFAGQILSTGIKVRSYDHSNFTRLVFESTTDIPFRVQQLDHQIQIIIDQDINSLNTSELPQYSVLIGQITNRVENGKTYIEVSIKDKYTLKDHFILKRPYRVVFDIAKVKSALIVSPKDSNPTSGKPVHTSTVSDANTAQSPVQDQFTPSNRSHSSETIQCICIDPGHGGNDIGAEGNSGILEKDLTLEISKKLKNIISARLGIKVELTRSKDAEVSLNHRAAIANNLGANLFVSIHINGSYRSSVRGPEIYFASLKATDTKSFNLAQKENKSFNKTDQEEGSKLNMILWNMSQTQHIKESSRLAEAVQEELNILMNTVNRGVKQAPFRVLMRANMPAILIEVAFITNRVEEEKLSRDSFLERVAGAIFKGIEKYVDYYNNRFN
jgi:N-acetylmuramoyl-L-alanine amidase